MLVLRSKGEELYMNDHVQQTQQSKVSNVHHMDLLHIGLQVGGGQGEVGPDHAFPYVQCRDHCKEEAWDEGEAAAAAVYDGTKPG